jgi:serine/threonine protein kinase
MSDELTPGAHFGEFSVEELIGKGGMGLVYRATQIDLQRQVALKIIAPSLASDPDFRDRFDREARRAAAIDHPAIIPIYATGEVNDQPYIAMRFIKGSDLASLIARHGRLDPAQALAIIHQIADALDAAHAGGLVHRDVKPANILIEPVKDGPERAYLTDFGLTRAHTDTRVTQTGTWMGTIDYMPPEQFQGDQIDGRADQYSLACVTYELLTGTPPFPRDAGVAAMYAHINTPPPRLTDTLTDLSTSADDVIAKAMAKSPADRYDTCEQFIAALDHAIQASPGTPSRQPGVPQSTPTVTGATAPATSPARRRLLTGAGAALLIAVIAVVVILLASSNSKRTRTAQATTTTTAAPTTRTTTTAPAPALAFPAESTKQWLALAAQPRTGKVQYDDDGISDSQDPQLDIWFGPKYVKVSYQNTANIPLPALEEWLIPAGGGKPIWGCIDAYRGWRCLRGGQLSSSFLKLISERDTEWVTPVTTRGVLLEMSPARTVAKTHPDRLSFSYEKAEDGRLPESCLDYTLDNIDRSACLTQTGFLMDYTPANLKKISASVHNPIIFGYERPVPLPANAFVAPARVR